MTTTSTTFPTEIDARVLSHAKTDALLASIDTVTNFGDPVCECGSHKQKHAQCVKGCRCGRVQS